jgi:hypothetical protein
VKTTWAAFAVVIVASSAILGWTGLRIYQQAPPIPSEVATPDGKIVVTRDDIQSGPNVWQSMGGMELGSIWGHGSTRFPRGRWSTPHGRVSSPRSASGRRGPRRPTGRTIPSPRAMQSAHPRERRT